MEYSRGFLRLKSLRAPARKSVSYQETIRSEDRRRIALMMAIGRAMVEDKSLAGLDRFLSDPIAF
jgi:hypothetical protein